MSQPSESLTPEARVRALLEQWLIDGYTVNETPLDDYGREVVRDVLSLLADAPAERAEPQGWQPIATAPKDGTRVLLTPAVWTAERVVTAYQSGSAWWIESASASGGMRLFTAPEEDDTHWPFTHWMPLPEPPR